MALALVGCKPDAPTRPTPAAAQPETALAPASSLTAVQRRADFEQLWAFVDREYPFFADKHVEWARVRQQWGDAAENARTDLEFLHVLEGALEQLYDPHCMLNTNADDSWRPVPGSVWVERVGEEAVVTAVERGSAAAAAGVRTGQIVVSIGGRDVAEATAARYPSAVTPGHAEAEGWALLSAVAGQHAGPHRIAVAQPGRIREIQWTPGSEQRPLVESRRLQPDVGYIAISTFSAQDSSSAVVEAFDAALAEHEKAKSIIIDVRSNRGGDTMVAKPIMGRFIERQMVYAKMARRDGEQLGEMWDEAVEPRGPWTFKGDVVVLVDRLSISMAEGFAMGMRGLGRARIVGTAMAGLGAATGRVTLKHSQIPVQISTEPVYDVSGQPRWTMQPDVVVDVVAQARAGVEDPILAAGVEVLARQRKCKHCAPGGKCKQACCRPAGWISCRVNGRNKRCVRYSACPIECCDGPEIAPDSPSPT